jgi:O-acetyl-ADP-ribose deacetylase (regulator of RNase III)
LADQQGYKSIAFPNISTGVYRFPKRLAAEIAVKTVTAYRSSSLEEVIFICFDEENYLLYQEIMTSGQV